MQTFAPPSKMDPPGPPSPAHASEDAEADSNDTPYEPVRPGSFWRRKCLPAADWLFGALTLIAGLAACSVVPVLNFLSLGYLLNASATVAKTGRWRDGFVGVRKASAIGGIIAGTWLVLWPLRIVSGFWQDAQLISPGSGASRAWHAGLIVLTTLTFLHIAWALLRGGRLWHFLWPAPLRLIQWLREPSKFGAIQKLAGEITTGLRLPFLFWLGVRGFVGALLWLIVPVGILIAAMRLPTGGAVLLSLLGMVLLALVVMHLPFLQTNFASTNRFRALFEVRRVRELFRHAPLAFWTALLATLLSAIPLYLLKIELTPRELAWLPSLVFVLFIYPARVLTGWAIARARRRGQPGHTAVRWLARLAILPVVTVYALVVFATPYLSWNGARSLFEQHAFLVPAPLMAL